MKKLITFFAAALFLAALFTSCGNDAKKLGKKAGELYCEKQDLSKDIQKIDDKIRKKEFDLTKKSDREDYVDLVKEKYDLEVDRTKLQWKIDDLEAKRWDNYKDEGKYEDWCDDFKDAQNKAEEKCKK